MSPTRRSKYTKDFLLDLLVSCDEIIDGRFLEIPFVNQIISPRLKYATEVNDPTERVISIIIVISDSPTMPASRDQNWSIFKFRHRPMFFILSHLNYSAALAAGARFAGRCFS